MSKLLRLFLLIFVLGSTASAQTPGFIFQPMGGGGVTPLNPNGDSWSSLSTSGYVTNDLPESDIIYTPLPAPYQEPTSDLRRGADCFFSDIVRIDAYDSGVYMATDGPNLMFRFRLGGNVPGAKGYSILIDTDNRFGGTGPTADPNYIAQTTGINGNPGFEIEIVLETNFQVAIYNVDGTDSPSAPLVTYTNLAQRHQRSVSLTNNCADPDYFYDFYITLADLYAATGITANTPLRLAATTVMAPKPAIGGPVSDINGGASWEDVINNQCGSSINNFGTTGFCPVCTAAPVVTSPIAVSATSISGTWTSLGASHPSTADLVVYRVRAGITTTLGSITGVATGANWTLNAITVQDGDRIFATAQSAGRSLCGTSNQVSVINCVGAVTPTPVFDACSGRSGIAGVDNVALAGATVEIYRLSATGQTVVATIVVNAAGEWGWGGIGSTGNNTNPCTGSSDIWDGTYLAVATQTGLCSSPASGTLCITTGETTAPFNQDFTGSSTAPTITTNPIQTTTTSITGTAVTGALVRLYVNGSLLTTTTAAAGAYTFSGLVFTNATTVLVRSQQPLLCATDASRSVSCAVAPPSITANATNQIASGTVIVGTSTQIGATVSIFNAGTNALLGTAIVQANGSWTSAINSVAPTTYRATQATACGASTNSNTVTAVAATSAARCGNFTATPYNEKATAITGTLSSAAANTIVNLYIDGVLIGTVTTNVATWSIPVNTNGSNQLYAGAVLSVGVRVAPNMETICPSTTTVQCFIPAAPVVTVATQTVANSNGTVTYEITNSVAGVLYCLEDANTPFVDYGISVFSTVNGSTLYLTSFPFVSAGTYNLRIKGMTFSGAGCEDFFPVTVVVPDGGSDGLLDPVDIDDDDDGIPDVVEACGLGATNFSCLPSGADPSGDADGDGILNYEDSDFCTLNANGVCTILDTDGDGIINQFDLDSDNDGIPDLVEAGGVDTNGDGRVDITSDQDGDGLIDAYDPTCTGGIVTGKALTGTRIAGNINNPANVADGNAATFAVLGLNSTLHIELDGALPVGTTLALQLSSDVVGDASGFITSSANGIGFGSSQSYSVNGTGVTTINYTITIPNTRFIRISRAAGTGRAYELDYSYTRCSNGVSLVPSDADGDGVPNFLDLDSDNDGIADVIEAGGTDANGDGIADSFVDLDKDGFNDILDGDINNDGIIDNPNPLVITGPDNNNDGRPDSYPNADNDGDGIPNMYDLDSDNDGIADVVESGGTDANGDGRADNFVDTDRDGFNDRVDGDVGNNGIAENTANAQVVTGADNNGDGRPNSSPTDDNDGDGILNIYDLDSDNDGIADVVEAGGTDANGDGRADNFVDADKDGFNDVVDGDPTNTLTAGNDAPAANTADALILTGADSNGDGRPNSSPTDDNDGDGILNIFDLDSDNDGISDVVEAGGTDTNGDGRADNFIDADNDGFNDVVDGDPTNTLVVGNDAAGANTNDALILTGADTNGDGKPNSYVNGDFDGDGLLNIIDLDADNDGVADVIESGGRDGDNNGIADNYTDTDRDGFNDSVDGDVGNDGIAENTTNVQVITGADTNGDGNPNSYPVVDDADRDNHLNFLDLDSDNDGITDVVENNSGVTNGAATSDNPTGLGTLDGFVGNNGITDANNNGWHDASEGATLTDNDNDGIADIYDIDVDNDGIADYVEATCSTCPTFSINYPTGTDANENGILDQFENLTDANGVAGPHYGLTPNNHDGTDKPDYLDLDTDNDTGMDWAEGFDNGFGTATAGDANAAQEIIAMAAFYAAQYELIFGSVCGCYPNTDADGDGLPVWLDSDDNLVGYDPLIRPSFLNPASIYWVDEDNDGLADIFDQFINTTPVGSFSEVPNADAINDRDWRDVILPVTFPLELLQFNAIRTNPNDVKLYWTTASEINNEGFDIERMLDNETDFQKVGFKPSSGATNIVNHYDHIDRNPYPGVSYYRLRQVDIDGNFVYTPVRAVYGENFEQKDPAAIFPNPVGNIVNVRFGQLSENSNNVTIRIIDATGKVLQNVDVSVASYQIISLNVADYPAATYAIHILFADGSNQILKFIHE